MTAAGFTFGLNRIQPGIELGRSSSAAGVYARRPHALGCVISSSAPAWNERGVCQDRGTQQRILGRSRSLQSMQESRVSVVGSPKVEELDAAGEEKRLRQTRGNDSSRRTGCRGNEVSAQTGVLRYCAIQLRGLNCEVQAPVGCRYRRII
jgi:hypothetical protein